MSPARSLLPRPGPWSRYEYKFTTGAIAPSIANHLEFTVAHPGTVWLQLVSLMQPTFHDRPNGNRVDLMQRMAAMQPHFLRLPGGNYLEGSRIDTRFNWKKMIGPMVNRPTHPTTWSYHSSDGMGLLEFLEARGIRPGARLSLIERNYDKTLSIRTGTRAMVLGRPAADKVWVAPL